MNWPHVDYDADLWMRVPDSWDGTPWKGPKDWARHMSDACWDDSDLDPSRKDRKALAETLRQCAERFPQSYPGFDLYLHLPDPRFMPLPVYVASVEADGDREETLRALVTTDDADLVEDPIVEEFTTDLLGTGMRSLRYTRTGEERTIVAGVRYAWRAEKVGCDVVVIAAAPDPRRVLGAMDDLDAFAARIRVG
ncbi:hypothetical protein [Streptomyces tsukubensis]|uniref:Uncharacterized protein n=1 Tax=Streptomyces tsukubensis TaxID=83656 RepID=A0A1V4A4B6_9ACTN|nr:hypothetical protein [Streptomyces tsukubensis]OON75414.1 hypothetical protein B1H18_23245 [Streptomyces tsukubensis]QFR94971.1 hypothetical protein GBW32_20540 [Streptomyces tsukubensis]